MWSTSNPNYRELIAEKLAKNHFSHALGFEMTSVSPGRTEGRIALAQQHQQQNGFVHGGVVLTLCDIVAGFAAFTLVDPTEHVVTAEIKVSCLRPGVGESLRAVGYVIKPGKHIHFCESEIYALHQGEEKLIAKSSSSMAVVRQKGYAASSKNA